VTTLRHYALPVFTLGQAGPDGEALCRRVVEWSGVHGAINGPYAAPRRRTPYWMVRITGYIGVSVLAERCWPWLSDVKREQYERAISRYEDYRTEHQVNDWRTRTTCKRGHELSGDNLHVTPKGHWRCRACHRMDEAARRERQRENGVARYWLAADKR
jgi:hypothetical protein